jgi:hypothetical protein
MEYEIFSIGDPAFLAETLRATVTILNRDDLSGIVAIGFLFTFIWTIVQGVLTGGKEIKIQNIVMAGLIYAAFFGVKVDRVNVWSLYGMELHQVEDVPLGLAFSGTVISKVGNNITEWFEQEYTVIGMTTSELGTGFALKALYEMRGLGFADGSLRWDPNGHLTKTLDNYVNDCVVPGTTLATIDANGEPNGLPAINLAKVSQEDSAWEHLEWNNEVYATKVYPYLTSDPTPADKSQVKTCAEAYEYISEHYFSNPAVVDTWVGQIGETVCNEAGYSCESFKLASGDFDTASFSNQFGIIRDSIMTTDVNLDKFMLNRALGLALGRLDAHEIGQGDALVAGVTQKASANITANQALQQTMFEKMMLPLMTFFEALMYVAAPFAAILVAFGMGGIQMIGKYLVFALWIQLWKPVAAVGNMFIQMSVAGEMSNLSQFAQAKGHSITSLASQPEVFDALQHWIGVGGMLVASTPMITLMLMYGSAVTASSLAGRIDMGKGAEVGMDGFSGKSQIGDAKASLTKNGGEVAMGNDQTADATQGTISMGAAMNTQAQQAEALASTASKQAQTSQTQAIEQTQAAGTTVTSRNSTATTSSGETVSAQEYGQQQAERLVEQGAISEADKSTVATGISARASAGADLGKILRRLKGSGVDTSSLKKNADGTVNRSHLGMVMSALGGKVEGGADYQDRFNEEAAKTRSLADVSEKAWTEGESERKSWKTGFQHADEDSLAQSEEWKASEKSMQQYQTSQSRAESAEQKASTLRSMAGTAGYSQQYQIATLSADAGTEQGMKEFGQFLQAKQNQGDPNYAGMQANVGDYRKALRTANREGEFGDLAELMGIAGHNVEDPTQQLSVESLKQEMMENNGAPTVGGNGPAKPGSLTDAATSMSQGAQNALKSTGGATDKQMSQIEQKGGGNLSAQERQWAGQAAALTANGGMKNEDAVRNTLSQAGVSTAAATSGAQLALATAGMKEKIDEGKTPQQAFDESLAETSAMADLGESVGQETSQDGAASLVEGDSTGSGSGEGDASGATSTESEATGSDSSEGSTSGATSTGSESTSTGSAAGSSTANGSTSGSSSGAGSSSGSSSSSGSASGASTGSGGNGQKNGGSTGSKGGSGDKKGTPKPQGSGSAVVAGSGSGKTGGVDFMGTEGAKHAQSLLNSEQEPLSKDGNLNLDSMDSSARQNAADQWLADNPEVDPENMTQEQAQQFMQDMGLLDEGEFQGVEKDGDAIQGEKNEAMENSDIREVGGKGKAMMDFLDTGIIQKASERSGDGSAAGMAVGGGIGAGMAARAAMTAGESVVKGMLRGAATGTFRGGAWGAAVGAAVGAAEGYMDHKESLDQEKAGKELKNVVQGNGDFSQLTEASQETINATLEGVIAKQVVAMDQAAAQGEEFDEQDFMNNELDAFERQVYEQGDALLSSGQGYADGLGMDMAEAIDTQGENNEKLEQIQRR